jgi:hypothetical protein
MIAATVEEIKFATQAINNAKAPCNIGWPHSESHERDTMTHKLYKFRNTAAWLWRRHKNGLVHACTANRSCVLVWQSEGSFSKCATALYVYTYIHIVSKPLCQVKIKPTS